MDTVLNLAIHVAAARGGGYNVEVRAYGGSIARPLVVEYYGGLCRDELEQTVGAVLDTLRPGTGVFSDGMGTQDRLPAFD